VFSVGRRVAVPVRSRDYPAAGLRGAGFFLVRTSPSNDRTA
jgi:hypothetical protein